MFSRSIAGVVRLQALWRGHVSRVHIHEDTTVDLRERNLRLVGTSEALSAKDPLRIFALNLSYNVLASLPDALKLLKNLVRLDLEGNALSLLPAWLGLLHRLKHLSLANNQELVGVFPSSMRGLSNLTLLNLSKTGMHCLPDWLTSLRKLSSLDVGHNEELGNHLLDAGWSQMTNLTYLNMESTGLTECPQFLTQLNLHHLIVGGNWELGDAFDETTLHGLSQLRTLDLTGIDLKSLSCISHMAKLENLVVKRNRSLTEQIHKVDLAGLKKMVKLDLSCIGLSKCPNWLGDLNSLTELNVGGNRKLGGSIDDPANMTSISYLTNLTSLDLRDLSLVGCLPWIRQMTQLQEINLSGNISLGENLEIWNLGCLTNLRMINLSSIRLSQCPDWIGDLKGLHHLILSENIHLGRSLHDVQLGHLQLLSSLDLSSVGLKTCPSWLRELTQLQVLILGWNQELSLDDDVMLKLCGLETLDLTGTGQVSCPQCLRALSNLRSLGLGQNENLGRSLENSNFLQALSNLTVLDLQNIGLRSCPEWIGDLIALQMVYFNNNKELETISYSLARCTSLRILNTTGCLNLHTPPPHVCKRGAPFCLKYLRDLNKGHVESHMLKMMLVGEPKAGKSSLLDTLETGRPRMRADDDRTVSVVVKSHKLNQNSRLVINSYDAGGHDVYLATHRFFMSPGALYVCVIDLSQQDCHVQAFKWVEAVQSQVPGAAVSIVGTHADLLEAEANVDDDHGESTPESTSNCASRRLLQVQESIVCWEENNVKELHEELREAEAKLAHLFDLPEEWYALKRERDHVLQSSLKNLRLDLQVPLKVKEDECFHNLLSRAKQACDISHQQHLVDLHFKMHEIEKSSNPKVQTASYFNHASARDERENLFTLRLRELISKRPRIFLFAAVSLDPSAMGVEVLRDTLECLIQDQKSFPLTRNTTPLSYLMLESCFRLGGQHVATSRARSRQLDIPEKVCPRGHRLSPLTPGIGATYMCDQCSQCIISGEQMMSCTICSWDLCMGCCGRTASHVWSNRLCPSGHVLSHFRTPGVYICDRCSALIERGQEMIGCRECGWDLCQVCSGLVECAVSSAEQAKNEETFGDLMLDPELSNNDGEVNLSMPSLPRLHDETQSPYQFSTLNQDENVSQLDHIKATIEMLAQDCKSVFEEKQELETAQREDIRDHPDTLKGQGEGLIEREWEQVVQAYTEQNSSHELLELCARPYVQAEDLVAAAVECNMEREEVFRALDYLHNIGAVLYYGNDSVHERLRGYVFTRPQWIIDAIKFVVHERDDRNLNDELRNLHGRMDMQGKRQLESLRNGGRLCDRLLRCWLWENVSEDDKDVLIYLLQGFKLMHQYQTHLPDEKFCQVCARQGHCSYVVPAMFPKGSLDGRYTLPSPWSPQMSSDCRAIVRREYQCSHFESFFLSELQVEWSTIGHLDHNNEHISVEVLGQSAEGMVLRCEESEFVDETLVVRMAKLQSSSGSAMESIMTVVSWVDLVDACSMAATEWPLFRYVNQSIEAAERRQPGLHLVAMIPCGEDLSDRKLLQDVQRVRRVTLSDGKTVESRDLLPTRRTLRRCDLPAVRFSNLQKPQLPVPSNPFTYQADIGEESNHSQQDTSQAPHDLEAVSDPVPQIPGYLIRKRLGKGMQGSIWLAEQFNKSLVVIKIVKAGLNSKREYDNLSQIAGDHPNVVHVVDVLQEFEDIKRQRFLGLVMDYVEGESLRQKLDREIANGQESTSDLIGDNLKACHVMCDVLAGLSVLHAIKPYPIVHRDIKPANIMIRDIDGSAVVVDLGVSKRYGLDDQSITSGDFLKGTLAYASPEIAMGGGENEVDQRSDVWSCGIVLYEMVSGKRPFEAENSLKLIECIKIRELPQLLCKDKRKEKYTLGRHALAKVLVKALSKDRNGRFHDASDMLRVLKMICECPNVVPCELISTLTRPVSLKENLTCFRVVFFSCRCGTDIDPERECQEFKDLFRAAFFKKHKFVGVAHAGVGICCSACTVETCCARSCRRCHFSGHGSDSSGGLYWYSETGRKQQENQVTAQHLSNLIQLHARASVLQKIECIFLNACSTLSTGYALRSVGVKVVVCWHGIVRQSVSRKFSLRFYELLSEDHGNYWLAFMTVCNEMAQDLRNFQPCMLHLYGKGTERKNRCNAWRDGRMVDVVEPEENEEDFRMPLDSSVSEESWSAEEEEQEQDDPDKNWRVPRARDDFAALAGQSELRALRCLAFKLRMPDGSAVESSEVDKNGFITQRGLRAIGVDSYTQLWRRSGKIVKKAKSELRASNRRQFDTCPVCKEMQTCGAAEQVMEKVDQARHEIENSIYYRQMDLLAHRRKMELTGTATSRQFGNYKKTLLTTPRRDIISMWHRDLAERNETEIGRGTRLSAAGRAKLSSACQSHLFQMDIRQETLSELEATLHRLRGHVHVSVIDDEGSFTAQITDLCRQIHEYHSLM
ncbi:hypothetical protein GUITHDRAFT_106084 [Guillardia theta CCMP2712]|uniref:non-specific serine/threonine protein kinase n=1 Tax=Guillardia theta (strain CCMP2712) TaxID=905079 RepID=L1JJ57_GUITC|nr:hypothetical protein GUITHDRAFT_106084 [Guillardia theta CCMP2712]EKX48189.1 hypothetical protein GUITHDRAFT_106084 [Guillardia theta CCMP2712]|eukprot:XP_005835169.1 hypothetical protein GUITHDRAFT_106084 [Guillardia theta CCMP2712]